MISSCNRGKDGTKFTNTSLLIIERLEVEPTLQQPQAKYDSISNRQKIQPLNYRDDISIKQSSYYLNPVCGQTSLFLCVIQPDLQC